MKGVKTMSESTKSKRLAMDTLLFGISSFGSKILVFFLTPLYTSVLLTEEYGVADLISTTVNFIYPVLTLAIADATLRFAIDKEANKNSVLQNCLLFTGISCVFLMLLYPLMSFVDISLRKYWIFFVLTYVFFNLHHGLSSFIKGLGKTKLFAVQGIVHTLSVIISNIIMLVVLKKGLTGYLLSVIIGYIVPSVLIFFKAKIYNYLKFVKFDISLTKNMLRYSIPMIPTLLAWAINNNIDKYMILAKMGLSENGIYSAAHKIPTLMTTVILIFTQAWQLSAIENVGSEDEKEYHSKIYGSLNVVSVLGCMCIIPLSQILSKILFAEAYFSAWQYVPLLTVAALFSSLAGFMSAPFRAYKKTKMLFASVAASSVCNIVLNFVLMEFMGTVGAACATAVSFFVMWLVRFITAQKFIKMKINVIKTVATYIILTAYTIYFTYYVKYTLVISLIAIIAVVALNLNDFKNIISTVIKVAKKFLKRK